MAPTSPPVLGLVALSFLTALTILISGVVDAQLSTKGPVSPKLTATRTLFEHHKSDTSDLKQTYLVGSDEVMSNGEGHSHASRRILRLLRGVDHRQGTRRHAKFRTDMSWRHSVSELAKLRKQELESLRMEADCLQVAGAVHSASLKSHFIGMAKKWSSLAAWGLEHGYRGQDLN